ncbi:MAG: glycosyltransferase family 4 protein [Myxococcales bacterium]|nr:glycosyltransferase family 4 protein [Myxococcales bacterium]
MRISWLAYGDLGQPTGGYVYDRLVVEALRALGDDVRVEDPRDPAAVAGALGADAVVGDGLCMRELGPLFERVAGGRARVLLVHHLTSWEPEWIDRAAAAADEARAIAASDRIVVTGARTAQRFVEEHGTLLRSRPDRDVVLVPPGADRLPRLPRRAGPPGRLGLLSLGSLIPRKRLPLVLDALEELARPEVTLSIIGDASRDAHHARALAARIAGSPLLRAAVRLEGVADDDGVARALASADALVLASSLEGYGMVVAEALHAGVPVIVSRAAAEAAGVESSGPTLVFCDRPGLVDALRRMCDDPGLREAAREAALACKLPRWDETAAGFRAALRPAETAARARGSGPSR